MVEVGRRARRAEYKSSGRLCIFLAGTRILSLWGGRGRRAGLGCPYGCTWGFGGQERHSDQRFIQVLEADALDVASIGRAVAAGAEVRRGGVPGGAEAAGGGHQAADGGAGHLRPESGFDHGGAGPAGEPTHIHTGDFWLRNQPTNHSSG